jgi:hypothetical protein
MPFKLHRSRAFWLGLPVFLFIVWAWMDSLKFQSRITLHRSARGDTDTFRQFLGTVDLRWWLQSPEPNLPFKYWRWTRKRQPHEHRGVDPQPITFKKERFAYGSVVKTRAIVILPHWFLLALYMIPWAGLLAWRWRAHSAHQKLVQELGNGAVSRTSQVPR